ncbi:helix-turn-helix domain-containing protein [Cognatiyoonia sp. IB215182]|uniref:helix-turn-helix domain-containing protein n=1 Tax=Cognatiyoonia sp. IB215182 TaxID=3097353 RepID=UPI002A13BD27|nr:helix-turn-helix domain-containing protein [Cognatiyoonia sp. IB215182]MDX8355655.1 helix-turn-helix domain-containing protein [Cognatiyoonia sp. IB215182]
MENKPTSMAPIEYSTLDFEPKHQFEAISQAVAPICELKKPYSVGNGFRVRYLAYDLCGIDIIDWESEPTISDRSSKLTRKSDLDSWAILFVRSGCRYDEFNDRLVKAGTGDLMLASYAQPWKSHWEGGNLVTVGLDRDTFSWMAPSLDEANRSVLNGPLTGLLRTFISTLVSEAHKISEDQKQTLSRSFSSLLAASLEPTADNLYNATPALNATRLTIAREFIRNNLGQPELSVDFICKSLGMSRRTLYNTFDGHGGVAKYIKTARLQACYKALSDHADLRFVSTIAYQYGFTNMSLFSRQFKELYGFSPKEAHDHAAANRVAPNSSSPTLLEHLCKSTSSSGSSAFDVAV